MKTLLLFLLMTSAYAEEVKIDSQVVNQAMEILTDKVVPDRLPASIEEEESKKQTLSNTHSVSER